MRFHVLTAITNFLHFNQISEAHATVFHGLARRQGHTMHLWANSNTLSPLLITHSGTYLPPIFRPDAHLVVSEECAIRLRSLGNIKLLPVVFEKLVDVDYPASIAEWLRRWGHSEPTSILASQPNRSSLHDTAGSYFEVLPYHYRDAVIHYPNTSAIDVVVGTPPLDSKVRLQASEELFAEFPIIWFEGSHILSEMAFRILDKYISPEHFITREYVT